MLLVSSPAIRPINMRKKLNVPEISSARRPQDQRCAGRCGYDASTNPHYLGTFSGPSEPSSVLGAARDQGVLARHGNCGASIEGATYSVTACEHVCTGRRFKRGRANLRFNTLRGSSRIYVRCFCEEVTPQNGPCPAVPMHPSNVSVNDNISEAKALNTLNSPTVWTPYGSTQPDLNKGATCIDIPTGWSSYIRLRSPMATYIQDPDPQVPVCASASASLCALPRSITRPDGVNYALNLDTPFGCSYPGKPQPRMGDCRVVFRLNDVHSGNSYRMAISYQSNTGPMEGTPPPEAWFARSKLSIAALLRCRP